MKTQFHYRGREYRVTLENGLLTIERSAYFDARRRHVPARTSAFREGVAAVYRDGAWDDAALKRLARGMEGEG